MTPPPRRRARRRRHSLTAAPTLTNAVPITSRLAPVDVLSSSDIERLHRASIDLLEHVGIELRDRDATKIFSDAGIRVDGNRVFPRPSDVERALETAPDQFQLFNTTSNHHVTCGGNRTLVMPGGGPAFVYDLNRTRRPGRLEDVTMFAKLTALSPNIHVAARKPVEACELPVATRHLDCWLSVLSHCHKPVQSGFVGGDREARDALEMLAIVRGGHEALAARATCICSVNVNSPLVYDQPMLQSLMRFAAAGQVILVSPFVMAGVTGPTTLAGALAQQNAEVLAGVILTQLIRPGTPVLYGSATSNIDMRSGAPSIGSPESVLATLATAQLARRYGLPSRGGAALTDSPIPDQQSSMERTFTFTASAFAGINYLMHGAGILESYLTISPAQFLLDLDMIAMVRRTLEGITVDDESLALDAIAATGHGGMFLDSAHTLARYKTAFFQPALSRRQSYEQWRDNGERLALDRAEAACRDTLNAYPSTPLPDATRSALLDFVEQRKKEESAR